MVVVVLGPSLQPHTVEAAFLARHRIDTVVGQFMSGRGRSDKGRGVVSQARKKQRRSDKRIAAALARCEEANPPTPPTSVFGRLGSQHESAS